MVRQGDSFALSDAVGFPARKPNDWLIQAEPKRVRDPFAVKLGNKIEDALPCLAN